MEHPIPLISVSKDGKFHVEKTALDTLKKINGKIGVVTVAGLYRTGKSYILNRLLDRQSGFEIGSTVNSQTKGIYIWGTPVDINHNGENMKVIFVDTEGIGSVEKDETHDTKIFALSILLSSFFIYNSFGVIDENALDKLSFITQLSHHIQSRSGDRSEIFPSFLWLLRDFTLDLVDTNNKPITSKQYLENSLNPVADKAGSERNKTKNEIRKTISQFFRERECVTLVRPTVNEKDLRNIDKVPYKELRPEFRKDVEALRKHVLESVEFKTIMGRKLNGEEFGIMCKSYVEAINNGAVPDLKSAWENIGMIENPRAAEDAYKQYVTLMKAGMDKAGLPMAHETLEALHRSADEAAMLAFNSKRIGDAVDNYIKELKEKIYAEYVKYQSNNQEKAVQVCKAVFEKLSKPVDDKVTQAVYKDVTDLLHELEALQTSYIANTKQQKVGLTSAQSEFCNLAPHFWNSTVTRTTKYLLRDQELKFTKLQAQLTELQKTYDQVRTDKEAALLDKVRLESLKVQLEKEIASLNSSMKDLQQKLSQLTGEKASLEADLKKGAADRAALEKRMQEEKDSNAASMKELKKQAKAEKETLTTTHDQVKKDLEARIAKLGSEQTTMHADFTKKFDNLEAEKESLQRTMTERITKTELERDTQKEEVKKTRKSLGADLRKEVTERETVLSNLQKEKTEKEKLKSDVEKLSGEKESLTKAVSELKEQKKQASNNTEKLQSQLAELQKKLEAETEARKKDIEEKELADKKASSLSKSSKKETAELRKKLDSEEEATKKLKEERDTEQSEKKKLETELVTLRKQLKESEESAKKSSSELAEVKENLEEKTKEAKQLQKDLANEKKQGSEAKDKLSEQAEKDTEKEVLASKQKQQYEALYTTYRKLTKDNEALQKEIEELRETNQQAAQLLKSEKSRKLVSSSNNNNENNNNNNNDDIPTSGFEADNVEPEAKKRRVATPAAKEKTKTPAKKDTKVKQEKPKKEESEDENEDMVDPNTLTIPQLKRQLTKWNVDLPAQAEKKAVYVNLFRNYVAINPDAKCDDD